MVLEQENKNKTYFEFVVEPGHIPKYSYNGGTQALSEIGFLPTFREKLEYLHEHTTIDITNRIPTSKNEELMDSFDRLSVEDIKIQDIEMLNRILASTKSKSIKDDIHNKIRSCIEGLELDIQQISEPPPSSFLSKKLQLESSPKKGRFLTAVEDIEVGEEIVVESPTVTFLHQDYRYSNCAVCLRPVLTGIPCDNCNQVLFCSNTCREKGIFHIVECGHTDLIPSEGKVALIIRLLTSYSIQYFIENRQKIITEYRNPAALNIDKDVNSLFQLQAGRRNDSIYNLEKLAWTYYILFVLNQMKYFKKKDGNNFTNEEVFIAELIDNYLRIADDNCHEICELDVSDVNNSFTLQDICQGSEDIIRVIGAGIFPNISLFNNSCDVNTMKVHSAGSKEIMLAKRKIRAGEEISDFYGEHYFLTDKFTRRKNLGFSCCCEACVENYPLREQLQDFTQKDHEQNTDWALKRIELEEQAARLKIRDVKDTCISMGNSIKVRSPHEGYIVPEMYLQLANLLENNNKSLRFIAWCKMNM